MNNKIKTTELQEKGIFANKLSITGAKDEEQAKEAVETWADENNYLVTSLSLGEDGQTFITDVCSDDYN